MEKEDVFEIVMEESGTRVPTLQGGISSYLGYRQFGLSFNFTYSFGNKIRLLKLFGKTSDFPPYGEKNMRREFTRRWRTPGDETKTNIPALRNKPGYPLVEFERVHGKWLDAEICPVRCLPDV